MLAGVLQQKTIGRSDVGEGAGPASAFVADAAGFQVRRRQPPLSKRGERVPGVFKFVLRPPESAMDVNHQRRWSVVFLSGRRKSEIDELIRIGAVSEARISGRRRESEEVVRHANQN